MRIFFGPAVSPTPSGATKHIPRLFRTLCHPSSGDFGSVEVGAAAPSLCNLQTYRSSFITLVSGSWLLVTCLTLALPSAFPATTGPDKTKSSQKSRPAAGACLLNAQLCVAGKAAEFFPCEFHMGVDSNSCKPVDLGSLLIEICCVGLLTNCLETSVKHRLSPWRELISQPIKSFPVPSQL